MGASSQQLSFQSRKFAARRLGDHRFIPVRPTNLGIIPGTESHRELNLRGETHKKDEKLKAGHPNIVPDALAGQKLPLALVASLAPSSSFQQPPPPTP